ncbi:hypothetical protein [Yersinia proxima]|uniref:hypothetical protein n=1 Tax=Yersinia proxima TaxID=2890316 RepID=UPI001D11CF0F|nr:hypothetical protein [Yersinia proxima]
MRKFGLVLLLMVSYPSVSKNMDDFFIEYPDIKENIALRHQVISTTQGLITMDSYTSGTNAADTLKNEGYDYAKLALRQIVNLCELEATPLNHDECELAKKNSK